MNKDDTVIQEFGDEWERFNYQNFNKQIMLKSYLNYFSIFPWNSINTNSIGFDMGCGSGRWSWFVAPKVKKLFCIEPSKAINIARKNLDEFSNVEYLKETTDTCSLESNSQDFGYSIGVLHHIPDTKSAIGDCARLLKKGAPFLLYLYYNFENKPFWYKVLWIVSNMIRSLTSRLPKNSKKIVCNIIALSIYYPLSRFALVMEGFGFNVSNFPLSIYRNLPFYYCQNDALDRFGTRLEQRFSRKQISQMLIDSGFEKITFSNKEPFWCCIAYKK